jgi:hypothetical protein
MVIELLALPHHPFGLGMDVLMAEQVNQHQIAVGVIAPTLRTGLAFQRGKEAR